MTSLAGTKEERRKEAIRMASEMFRNRPHWVVFFREILGVGGVVRQLFPSMEDMGEFQQSEEYRVIQRMLTQLRGQEEPGKEREQTRVITVRLPAAVHDALREEAKGLETSINKLCITKLLREVTAYEQEAAEGALEEEAFEKAADEAADKARRYEEPE